MILSDDRDDGSAFHVGADATLEPAAVAVRATPVSETDADAVLRFSVTDTGIGIPADRQDILFQKLTQADSSTSRHFGGTGLGLAMSKQLAEMMGGEIGVISEVGHGSEFWFTVRMGKQTERECRAVVPADLRGARVLIVDDNGTNRQILLARCRAWAVRADDVSDGPAAPVTRPIITRHAVREMRRGAVRILLAEDNIANQLVAIGILKKLGLRADAAANGAEAVRAIETLPYDLVLMDVQMPEMDGLEATRQIREAERQQPAARRHRPIIAITAHAIQGDRERFLEAGMDDYLTKPVDPKKLVEPLEKWLPKDPTSPPDPALAQLDGCAPAGDGATRADQSGDPEFLVFDEAALMDRMMDDDDLARLVIETFLDDVPKEIQKLRDSLAAGDMALVERQAHSIKGASANVGGEALRAVALEMEHAAKAGDVDRVHACLARLDAEFARLKAAMDRRLHT